MNIYNVDCIEFMKTVWLDKFKGKIDLVIADPHIIYQGIIILIH